MAVVDDIRSRLESAFAPKRLEVQDDSAAHKGHVGAPEGGESHFSVTIRAEAFEGQSRIARHRAIHAAIGPHLMARIHALAIDVGV